jgi:formylglycine-generating enzyme required for sulfatase activity
MALIVGGEARRARLVLGLAAALVLAGATPAASDPEALRAATVKITVVHGTGTSTGAGIILCQRTGRVDVLTAKHVLTGQGLVDDGGAPTGSRFDVRTIEVAFHRDDPFPIRVSPGDVVIRSAQYKDLALLTLTGVDARLRTARLGSSALLQTGAGVESVGHLDVDWDWAEGSVRSTGEFIRHSIAIDHGYSGGPLFNAAGEVVGVNLQRVQGVARAMPIEEAMLTVRRWVDPQCVGGAAPLPPPPPVPPPTVSAPTVGERKMERIAGVEFAWRYVPPGTFQMGSPASEKEWRADETLHRVTLTRGFWMGETEVTQGQWQALMGNNPSRFKECGAECPVEQVSWYDAVTFANSLSKSSRMEECYVLSGDNGKQPGEGLEYQTAQFRGPDCIGFRLPTEAEWEYAARAGTRTPFWTGENLTTDQANYDGNYPYAGHEEGQYRPTTVAVRSFGANRWGLYEIHGNVWEWTQDVVGWGAVGVATDTYIEGGTDPLSTRGSRRVVRGGSWRSHARLCRAAYRSTYPSGYRYGPVGFRLVRTLH